MSSQIQPNSPRVLIRLDILGRSIRLSDVLEKTATICEDLKLQNDTHAVVVVSVDQIESWQEIVLFAGSYQAGDIIHFDYLPPQQSADDLEAA